MKSGGSYKLVTNRKWQLCTVTQVAAFVINLMWLILSGDEKVMVLYKNNKQPLIIYRVKI